GVLAMTLVRRLLGGAPQAAFLREIAAASRRPADEELLDALRVEWTAAADAVRAAPEPGLAAAALMELTGMLFFAACWIRLEAAGGDGHRAERIAQLGQYLRVSLLPNAAALRIRCQGLAQMTQQEHA
ncbi:MAG: hypothetical protein KKF33_20210, partial [Alphaproteobacteria bacterium]|nr:hypothetical protein [Alphaproteobacteria bacterium]